jgi:ribosomal protein S18 acetylase RimI-like enzyme
VALEPWRSLGYEASVLGGWLGRKAAEGWIWEATGALPPVDAGRSRARASREGVLGVVVAQPQVLLGAFISLVAVRPEAAGRGVGRALVERVADVTFARRRWLYTSSDAGNRAAAAFYRRLGFARVGRLPDLVKAGRTEILWRRGRSPT